ncbi:MAG: GTPase Era [Gammaproteobacteria bacterium]|nr:GTPase Era [Gammaproteobacteria bacterium]
MQNAYRSGIVAVVGRPNVGKSTLVNVLVGQKISITSRRPQTTQQRILGIKTSDRYQIVYVDTPGIHPSTGRKLNKVMNKSAIGSLYGVDCIVFMITAKGWTESDEQVLEILRGHKTPIVLAINKLDTLESKEYLMPLIQESNKKEGVVFTEIIPLSAKKRINVEELENILLSFLPEQDKLFPEDQVSDRSDKFMAAELIREQIFHIIGQEVPHAVAVGIETFKLEKNIIRVEAVIWVEKSGQKGILIGKNGEKLKRIGTEARKEMEKLFGSKVYLNLWVKVRENWRDSDRALRTLGFGED